MDNELILFDRLNVIKDTINKYGEDNFYVAYSGGKDSTIVHYLLDIALPNNQIPRVFINTGIEFIDMVRFVKSMAEKDDRFILIKPSKPIRYILETYGYPFKSKEHAKKVDQYQRQGKYTSYIERYLDENTPGLYRCPNILRYQFTEENHLRISHYCCKKLKKDPVNEWARKNKKKVAITGLRNDEGGERANIKGCAIFKNGKLIKFHPLLPTSNEWEDWVIEKYNIRLCDLYYEPYNFKRTGCKGCPFALGLQDELETLEKYLPNERKQCEIIWKPVYEEYRRIGYRLKKDEQLKLF